LGDLLLLPAMLASPLGFFFGGKAPEKKPSSRQWLGEETEEATKEPIASEPLAIESVAMTEQPAAPIVATLDPTEEEAKQLSEGPHAALHAKLRSLRREASEDSVSS